VLQNVRVRLGSTTSADDVVLDRAAVRLGEVTVNAGTSVARSRAYGDGCDDFS
jgi:hypothetical protein